MKRVTRSATRRTVMAASAVACVMLLAAVSDAQSRRDRDRNAGAGADAGPWESGSIDPAWADRRARQVVRFAHDARKTDDENGEALYQAILALQPGTRLEIGPGTFSIARKTSINLVGTERAPIWIVAAFAGKPDKRPVITRPDARQNVFNIGDGGDGAKCEYLCLRGLEFTGGSSLIRLYNCRHVWIDRCEMHHPGAEAITANVTDTERLHITRNHIHHMVSPEATAEGMYLGANNSKARMTYSVIALNHVHDCRGKQGDGIEVKQGSHHNWIVGNHVHDTNYPCIIAYGTDALGINVIERNVCYRSGDNVMQVQGEAIVRNNLLMAGKGAAFASHDHQGKTRALTVVHNTMISASRGAKLNSWNDREEMVFANNAVYTENGTAVQFAGGHASVTFVGNVVSGRVDGPADGFSAGNALADFRDAAFDASQRDARPHPRQSTLLGRAERRFICEFDLANEERKNRPIVGAFDVRTNWSPDEVIDEDD